MSEECSCGRKYESSQGVALCLQNRHGNGKDQFANRLQFAHTLCPEYTAVCMQCHVRLRGFLRLDGLNVEFNVVPHVCEEEKITHELDRLGFCLQTPQGSLCSVCCKMGAGGL